MERGMDQLAADDRAGAVLPHRIGFIAILLLLLAVVAAIPMAVVSGFRDFVGTGADQRFSMTPAGIKPNPNYNRLRVQMTGLDEWTGLATLQVTGAHICNGTCDHDARFLFVAVPL